MKNNYIKCSIWLVAALCITITSKAQTSATDKVTTSAERHDSYDANQSENGRQVERIQTDINDKTYKIEFVDNKMTELYVNGEKIAAEDWGKYSDDIAAIRLQIKRNREQAIRNQEQARLNEIQAQKNQQQAVRNQEQARLNELQEKKNEEQAQRNEKQAELNRLQEVKNGQQAVRNQEQEKLNEIQAKKNQEQAEENERLIKELTKDLAADKIIPNENSLHSFKMNSYEMIVNGVKQPDNVFKKYTEKYKQFSKNSMSYSNEGDN
jgi:chromosome segregation ATPase